MTKMTTVYFVGAGPGSADLITVKGMKILQQADVVLYDALISQDMLEYCKPDVQLHYVGKRCGQHSYTQDKINNLLLELSLSTKFNIIVRLKGGDPSVFARLQEEIDTLKQANIDFEIVAGVTSASAAAAALHIPLTQRGVCRGIQLRTLAKAHIAHLDINENNQNKLNDEIPIPISNYINNQDTIVFYMGKNQLSEISQELKKHNFSDKANIYLVENISLHNQRTLHTHLSELDSQNTKNWINQDAPLLLIAVNFFNI